MGVILTIVLCLFLNGCAWLDSLEDPSTASAVPPPRKKVKFVIPGPDAGAGIPLDTLYFRIEGYGPIPQQKVRVLENIFRTVTDKTALYTFKPKEKYRVVIYRSKEEFHAKTGQPQWSGGMKTGRGVYTYEQPAVDSVLAHEISHIIFGEFMGDQSGGHVWLNEGLAMVIDAHFHPRETFDQQSAEWLQVVRGSPLLMMEDILEFRISNEKEKEVSVWYNTIASLSEFLIDNGGSFNFALFLGQLKNERPLEEALSNAYPGKYRSLEELHSLWRQAYGL